VLQTAAAAAGLGITGGHVVADFEGGVRFIAATLAAGPRRARARSRCTQRTARAGAAVRRGHRRQLHDRCVDQGGARIWRARRARVGRIRTVHRFSADHRGTGILSGQAARAVGRSQGGVAPTRVGKHTITLANAWLSLEQIVLDGDGIGASAVLRTHAGRDALAMRVTLSHDLATATGAFTATGDWAVSKAVLATQLPGFNAAYDVDEGTIGLAMDGSWDASKILIYNAKGRIRIDGRKAHYDDYAILGLKVDVPFAMSGDSLSVSGHETDDRLVRRRFSADRHLARIRDRQRFRTGAGSFG
jgi:hypothetical protein